MRYVGSPVLAGVFCISLLLVLGAARPFDRVPLEDATYSHLTALSEAGLLAGYELPEGELSRVEVAVLTQRGLAAYGELLVAGGTAATDAEGALDFLLDAYTDEMSQLGAPAVLPGSPNTSMGEVYELERRIAYLEDERVEEVEFSPARNACCPDDPECPGHLPKVNMYGDFYFQLRNTNTEFVDPVLDGETLGDIGLYWGEFGWDISHEEWDGRFSFLWDDVAEELAIYEAWGRWTQPESGGFLKFGHLVLPFGNNDYYFPTYPAVNDLGFTSAHAVGGGVEQDTWGFSAYLFNPQVDILDEDDNFTDYSVVWNIARREADECQDGYALVAGYTSHLANDDIRFAGDGPFYDRAEAYNVFGRYDWNGNRYHLLADYTTAIEEFDQRDLDLNADGIGDLPSALNVEFVYEPEPDRLWGVNYQTSEEFADYANERIGVMFGRRLNELAMFKLEYSHGTYDEFGLSGQDTDDSIVGEINFAF